VLELHRASAEAEALKDALIARARRSHRALPNAAMDDRRLRHRGAITHRPCLDARDRPARHNTPEKDRVITEFVNVSFFIDLSFRNT
jgi:hypothetical protein